MKPHKTQKMHKQQTIQHLSIKLTSHKVKVSYSPGRSADLSVRQLSHRPHTQSILFKFPKHDHSFFTSAGYFATLLYHSFSFHALSDLINVISVDICSCCCSYETNVRFS